MMKNERTSVSLYMHGVILFVLTSSLGRTLLCFKVSARDIENSLQRFRGGLYNWQISK